MQGLGSYVIRPLIGTDRTVTSLAEKIFINLIWWRNDSFLWGFFSFTLYLQISHTSVVWYVQQQAQTSVVEGMLVSFPMTSVRGGRQGFRGTRDLIGRADGNTLKVRSAWGIDRRPGPVPRWQLCWRSFISLRAICCEWRKEYKEGERGRAQIKWPTMFSAIYLLANSLLFQIYSLVLVDIVELSNGR